MSDPFVGEIRLFGGTFAPVGWMLCQGQLLAIAEYETLFTLVGTTYGGDGISVFGLPNLASRVPVHQGNTYVLGQAAGAEEVTLTTNQLPAHGHQVGAANAAARTGSPTGGVWAAWPDAQYAATPNGIALNGAAFSSAGGSQPHDNMPPFVVVTFIISLFGIFPSQS